jgi:hypothetical protein
MIELFHKAIVAQIIRDQNGRDRFNLLYKSVSRGSTHKVVQQNVNGKRDVFCADKELGLIYTKKKIYALKS